MIDLVLWRRLEFIWCENAQEQILIGFLVDFPEFFSMIYGKFLDRIEEGIWISVLNRKWRGEN